MSTLITLLATLSLTGAACKATPVTRDDPAPTDDEVDATHSTEGTPNTLLTGGSVGDFGYSGDFAMTYNGEFYEVELAPGVSGKSLDGETLCQLWVTAEEYRTRSGLGVGSKIGDFGTLDVDLEYEPATGLIISRREHMALEPHDYAENEGNINVDAVVVGIRLGGCGE